MQGGRGVPKTFRPNITSNTLPHRAVPHTRWHDKDVSMLVWTGSIAVGMPVTRHPLHRSGREALPHPAPTLGLTANVPWATEGDPTTSLPYTRPRLGHARPALRPVRVTSPHVPLGHRPSLHLLRCPSWRIVRRLLRYSVGV